MRCTRVTAQGYGAVRGQSSPVVSLWRGFFCGRGAALVAARETQCLPALRGSNQRAAAPATLFRPPGRPCRKESQTFSLIPFRILWIASAVGCQSTHARLRSSSRGGQPALPALLEQPAPPVSAKAPGARDRCRQPAPLSTKAPGTRDHCRQPAPCLQKFLVLSTEGNRPSSLEQDSSARDRCRQPAPRLQKQLQLKNWNTWGQPVPQ